MDDYTIKMQALESLLDLNKKLTFYIFTNQEITEQEILEARSAASEVSKTGIWKFSEKSTNEEFFKEVQCFLNFLLEESMRSENNQTDDAEINALD